MAKFPSAYMEANGIRLHYYRTGGGKPPFVLVHGITDDGMCWAPVARRLQARYDMIMVDQRGHGKSESPGTGYTYTTLAADLAALIVHLDLEKPLVLGHSLGALTALVLAGLYPELPRAVLLEDPPAHWMAKAVGPHASGPPNPLLGWITGIKRKTRDELLAESRALSPGWAEAERGPWADSKHRFSLQIADLLSPRAYADIDFQDVMVRVACPVLVMYADTESGAILTDRDIDRLNQWVPQLQRARISGAGHNIRREQFARYMQVVQDAALQLTRG